MIRFHDHVPKARRILILNNFLIIHLHHLAGSKKNLPDIIKCTTKKRM
jgi:hypothetical protein